MGAVWFLEATTSWDHAGMTLSHACVRTQGGSAYNRVTRLNELQTHMHASVQAAALHRMSAVTIFWESLECWVHTQAPPNTDQPDRLCVLPFICLEISGLGVRSPIRRCTLSAFSQTIIERLKRKEQLEFCVSWTVEKREQQQRVENARRSLYAREKWKVGNKQRKESPTWMQWYGLFFLLLVYIFYRVWSDNHIHREKEESELL